MPWKVWGRERLAASDFQSHVQDQVVATFTSTSARDAAITAPKVGQLAAVNGFLEVYRGGAWRSLPSGRHLAFARQSVSPAQSIPNGAPTTGYYDVSLHVAEANDGNAFTLTGASAGRWTAPVAGWYRVAGGVAFDANGTGARGARIAKNGTTVVPGSTSTTGPLVGVAATVVTRPVAVLMAAGDFLTLQAMQNSGGALTLAQGTGGEVATMLVELVLPT